MLNLLFPRLCNGCKQELLKNESVLCTRCLHAVPLASHHKTDDATMKALFYGRVPIEEATALLRFSKKGITQELLHNLKYRGQKEISAFLGAWLGAELALESNYNQIEGVVAVPLHKKKFKIRGYNQVDGFAKALSKSLNVPYYETVLVKLGKTSSQVFKQRGKRFDSDGIFTLQHPELIAEKHLLLVDDIVTTGATIEKCTQQLLKAPGVKISLATMAIA